MSQRLTQLAKDNGSSDNITIIVVFLRPVEELVDLYETKYGDCDGDEVDSAVDLYEVKERLKQNNSTVRFAAIAGFFFFLVWKRV